VSTLIAGHSLRLFAGGWRARQIERIGSGAYKLAYSAVSLIGLVLVVRGFGAARAMPVVLWTAPAGAQHVAAALAVIGFVLIAAAYVPGTRMKAALGHPMTAGVGVWALGHLIANGRLADVVLFGSLLVWAIVVFAIRRSRDRAAGTTYPPGRLARDALVAVIGIVAALAFALFLHGPLIGVRPFG
jgi:uncharacterized membrane protein